MSQKPEKIGRKNLVAIAKAYAKGHGLSLSAVSRQIYGKADFLRDFDAGTVSMSWRNFWRAWDEMVETWPPKTDWPFLPAITFERPISVHKGKSPRKG
jgi:hypothetical protein